MARKFVLLFICLCAIPAAGAAQDNYEIQVYGSETVPPSTTMVELHSNVTARGTTVPVDGVLPTDHAIRETLEITKGLTPWSEIGFYCFTNLRSGDGYQWVGTHVRPRVRAPEEWGWPLGASLSLEAGYQRRMFAQETWSIEIRPIIDTRFGPVYLSVNPALEGGLSRSPAGSALQFSPGFKFSFDLDSVVTAGVEYYGSPGEEQHMLFPSLDLNVSPDWEINFGVGFGLTPSTDSSIVKLILGRRISL